MTIDEGTEQLIYGAGTPIPSSLPNPFSVANVKRAIEDTLATIEPGKSGVFLTTIRLDPATGTYSVQGAIAARLNNVWSIGATFDLPPTHLHDSSGFVGIKASW